MRTLRFVGALAAVSVLAVHPAVAAPLFSPVAGSPSSAFPGAQLVRLSPDGSRLMALNPGGKLGVFAVGGALAPIGSIDDPVLGCGGVAVSPDGARLYGGGGGGVAVFSISPGGAIARLQALGAPRSCSDDGIAHVSLPGGDFVYVNDAVDGGPNRVSSYRAAPDGLLTQGPAYATGDVGSTAYYASRRLVAMPGPRLAVVNAASVSVFDVRPDGTLVASPGSPIAVGSTRTASVAAAPDGSVIYVTTDVAVTKLVAAGAGFATGPSLPTASAAAGIDVDPSGRFVAVAFVDEDLVRIYDAATLEEIAAPVEFFGATGVAFGAEAALFLGSVDSVGAFRLTSAAPGDTTPPLVALRSLPALTNAAHLELRASASDPDDAVASASVELDGAVVGAPPVAAGGIIAASISFPSEGKHVIAVSATDEHGNTGSASATVVYDATPPSLTVDAAPPLTSAATWAFAGTASDANGIADVTVRLGATVLHPALAADGSFAGELPLAEGLNTVLFTATDRAGNATSVEAVIQRDTRSPELVVASPADGSATGSPSLDVVFTVADDSAVTTTVSAGGVVQTFSGAGSFTATVSAPGEGLVPVLVSSQDAAGNPPTVRSLAVLVDLSAPILDVQLADGAPLADGARFGPLPGDALFYTLRVDDLDGTTVALPGGAQAALPRGGGVLTGSTALTQGVNALAFQATDEVGRTSVLTRAVTYDTAAPDGAIVAPAARSAVRGVVELAARASDAFTGVARVLLSVDDAAPLEAAPAADAAAWTASLDTSALADGPHRLSATFVDGVGNASSDAVEFVVDNGAPTVALTALPPYVSGTITLDATASDAASGVARIALSVGGIEVKVCEGDALTACSMPFDTTALLAGPFTVSATARDAAGNDAAAAQTTSVVDNTRPSKFLVSPVDGDVVRRDLAVATHVVDDDFDVVECLVDGASLGVSHDPGFTRTVTVADRLDGALGVSCAARDLAGNLGLQAASVQVKRWIEVLQPRVFHLGARTGGAVLMLVAGPDVALLLPARALDLRLVVPGGAPVPVTRVPGADALSTIDRDRVFLVVLEFDRGALVAALRAGVASGAVDPAAPVPVRLFAGAHEIGADRIRVVR